MNPILKPAETAVAIHPLLQNRWSPRAFDRAHELSAEEKLSLLEAARWAPSSNNGQPWRWSLLVRGSREFTEISQQGITGFNAEWAPASSAFAVLSLRTLTDDGKPWPTSTDFDGGLSAMQLALQAEALGLRAHFMGGIRRDEIAAILNLPGDLRVMVVLAVGRQASPEILPEGTPREREQAIRSRLNLSEIVLHGLTD